MKKFTSQECLDYAINKLAEDPMLIRKDITTYNVKQSDYLNTVLWPAALNSESWTRLSTKRPSLAEGNAIGSDKEIRTYTNDIWTENDKELKCVVITEHEQIIDVQFLVNYK